MERWQHKYLINITIIIDFSLYSFYIYNYYFFFSPLFVICKMYLVARRCFRVVCWWQWEREIKSRTTLCWENIYFCLTPESDANTIKFILHFNRQKPLAIARYSLILTTISWNQCNLEQNAFLHHMFTFHTVHTHIYQQQFQMNTMRTHWKLI